MAKRRSRSRVRGAIPRRATGDLGILHDLVRTAKNGKKADRLARPADLAHWLASHGLLPAGSEVTPEEHRRGVELRDALVALVRRGRRAVERIQEVSREARFRLVFDAEGTPRYVTAAEGFDGALGRLLAMLVEAQRERSWTRLKVCRECGEIFYDVSNNRVGKWCTDRCGERVRGAKARRRRRYSG